jgi:hypothetical protein
MIGHHNERPALRLPLDFDDYGWEVESKGYFVGAVVEHHDRRIPITFYEPVRLAQDVAEEVATTGRCAFSNLVVIPAVTRGEMERAIRQLAESGDLNDLDPEA